MLLGGETGTSSYILCDNRYPLPFHSTYANVDAGNADTNVVAELIRPHMYPSQRNTHNRQLIFYFLNRIERVVNSRGTGYQFKGNFIYGPEVPYLYLLLTQAWPQLTLPSHAAALRAESEKHAAKTVSQHGVHFNAAPNDVAHNLMNAGGRALAWLHPAVGLAPSC